MEALVTGQVTVIKQHLIDPEICIRCNTCEATCPVGAITHDSRNYVVDPAKCEQCLACVPPCPTGSIDNWRTVAKARAYSIDEQLGWDALPSELNSTELEAHDAAAPAARSSRRIYPARRRAPSMMRRIGDLRKWAATHAAAPASRLR